LLIAAALVLSLLTSELCLAKRQFSGIGDGWFGFHQIERH
jgi:hypothetical protein